MKMYAAHFDMSPTDHALEALPCMRTCKISEALMIIVAAGDLADWWHRLGRVIYKHLDGEAYDNEHDVFNDPLHIREGLSRDIFLAFCARRLNMLRSRREPARCIELLRKLTSALEALLL